jgi:hypothetical protein
MPIPKWVRLWIAAAGATLVLGGTAWFLKPAVIVATEGRVSTTGAAGASFSLGLGLILIGSTGIGLRLAMNGETPARIAGIALAPVAFVASFMVLQAVVVGLLSAVELAVGCLGLAYVKEEAIILLTAIGSVAAGAALLAGALRGPRGVDPPGPKPTEQTS